MTTLKFKIDGVNYQATWNPIRTAPIQTSVDIQKSEPDGDDYEFCLSEGRVVPFFNWKEATPHRVLVANFLEGTNIYEVVKNLAEAERELKKRG